jgi:phosphate transport system permease protein
MIGGLSLRLRRERTAPDGFKAATAIVAWVVPVLLVLVMTVIAVQAWPALRTFGVVRFLTGRTWDPVHNVFGALPYIYGTLVSSLIALAIALIVGVGVALFLAEPNAGRVRGAVGTGVEMLAAVPSVVYGIWGLYVLAPWLVEHIDRPVADHLGWLPFFAPPARNLSVVAASVVLAVMIVPTLASISRDVIRAVPHALREASHALGSTWWETVWRVVLPAARPGIFGATILSLGRALGETMAVTMVIGNRPEVGGSLFGPGYTLASVIANEFAEASIGLYSSALLLLGLVLFVLTLVVNLCAMLLMRLVDQRVPAA